MRTYIVYICSRTSQRAKVFQRYNKYAAYCTVCLPTESKMGSLLQRCNGSMEDVLYEDLLYIVCICSLTS